MFNAISQVGTVTWLGLRTIGQRLGSSLADNDMSRLAEIPGVVPSLKEAIAGCIFAPRCAHATPRCRETYPPLEEKTPGHWVACWESDRLLGAAS